MRRFVYLLIVALLIPVLVGLSLRYDYSRLGWSFLLMMPGYLVAMLIFFREALQSETPLQDLFWQAAIFNVIINVAIIYKFLKSVTEERISIITNKPEGDA